MDEKAQQTPSPTKTPRSTSEEIAHGVVLERLYDEQLVIFTVTSVALEAIDAWAESAIALLETWPTDQPHLVMHDVSDRELALTPHIRKRAQDVANAFPDIEGRSAVIMPKGPGGFVLRPFINLLRRGREGREQRVFLDREKGLAWLEELLDKPNSTDSPEA